MRIMITFNQFSLRNEHENQSGVHNYNYGATLVPLVDGTNVNTRNYRGLGILGTIVITYNL